MGIPQSGQAESTASDAGDIRCTVELFGLARVLAGARSVEVSVHAGATVGELLATLGAARPVLVGRVLRAEGGGVTEGHSLSLNGLTFVDHPDSTPLRAGDRVLILANAAGGSSDVRRGRHAIANRRST